MLRCCFTPGSKQIDSQTLPFSSQVNFIQPLRYLPEGPVPAKHSDVASGSTCPASYFDTRKLGNICYTPRRPYTLIRLTGDELCRIWSRRRSHTGPQASSDAAIRSLRLPGPTRGASEFHPYRHSHWPSHAYYTTISKTAP